MNRRILAEITNYRTVLLSIAAGMIGILLLYISGLDFLNSHPNWQAVARDTGALFVASVALAMFWELSAKRSLVEEVMAIANLSEEVKHAGIRRILRDFYDLDWKKILSSNHRLDVFFTYARTWRNRHYEELELLARNPNAKVRIIVPDPNDDTLVNELANRFDNQDPGDLRATIEGSVEAFKKIFSGADAKAEFSVWYCKTTPVYSFYCLDDEIIFAVYKHHKGRTTKVPAFIVNYDGWIGEFVSRDLNEITKDGSTLGWKVFP
jgi:hypothetical protein